jgi:hypothetical protein
VLPGVSADVNECPLIGVSQVHRVSKKEQHVFFEGALVQNQGIDEIAAVAFIPEVFDFSDEVIGLVFETTGKDYGVSKAEIIQIHAVGIKKGNITEAENRS